MPSAKQSLIYRRAGPDFRLPLTEANLKDALPGGAVGRAAAGGLAVEVTPAVYALNGTAAVYYAGTASLALGASATTYLWLDAAGALQSNITGFPATGALPLAKVTTSAGDVTQILDERIQMTVYDLSSTGTDAASWTVNEDAVQGTDEDPALVLLGGDGGTDLVRTTLRQDSSGDLAFVTVERNTGGAGWNRVAPLLHLGHPAETADLDPTLRFSGGTGAANAQASVRLDGSADRLAFEGAAGGYEFSDALRGPDDGTGLVLGHAPSGASTGSAPQVVAVTTTQRGQLVAANGMMVYNATTDQFEVYDSGAWKALGSGGAVTGTESVTFKVNEDAAAAADEDPALWLVGGDGVAPPEDDVVRTILAQDSSAEALALTTERSRAGGAFAHVAPVLALGSPTNVAGDLDPTLRFYGASGGAVADAEIVLDASADVLVLRNASGGFSFQTTGGVERFFASATFDLGAVGALSSFRFNEDQPLLWRSGATERARLIYDAATKRTRLAQAAQAGGSPALLYLAGGAHMALAADTEAVDVDLALARTVEFTAGAGAFALQRAVVVRAPTYAATAAETIADAVTLEITGAPAAGANMTLTKTWALRVPAGDAYLGGALVLGEQAAVPGGAPGAGRATLWVTNAALQEPTLTDDAGTDRRLFSAGGADVPLADGGTGASLVASTGGIVYSTAAALAVLAGTATAGQMLRSGAAAAPTWSTATWPAATTVNQLLYSSAADTVAGLATAASAVLVTSAGGVPALATDLPAAVTIGGAYVYRAGGTDVALADGGTNASLVASNGGIFYSTATAGAILAGTATANQVLLSGATAAPAWSTATYPATTTANQLLYSSGTNTVAGLATANDAVLVTSGTGVPSLATDLPTAVTIGGGAIYRAGGTDVAVGDGGTGLSSWTANSLLYASATTTLASLGAATNGQIPIGSTGAAPVLAALTGTANQVIVTTGAGSITLAAPQDLGTASAVQHARLGLGAAADAADLLTLAQGTLVADAQALEATATWNAGATTFTLIRAAVTDTASAAGSLLLDLQVGGSSKIKVDKAGVLTLGTALAIAQGGTGAATAAAARTELGLAIGTDVQAWDADLDALAALTATAGMLSRTGAGAFAARTLTGTANQVIVSNGTGAAGDPTLSLPQNIDTAATPQFARVGLGAAANVADHVTTAGGAFFIFGGTIGITPRNNDGASLGTAGTAWSDLYLAAGAVIDAGNGGDTITHGAAGVTWAVAGTPAPAVAATGSILDVAGTLAEAASGTHAWLVGTNLAVPTITGGAALVTDAATLRVAGAPVGTFTNAASALWVAAGHARLDGTLGTGAATDFPDFAVQLDRAAAGAAVTANSDGGIVRVSGTIPEAASGTHAVLAGLAIDAVAVTDNAAATTVAVALYVAGAPTGGGTTKLAAWFDAGTVRVDGDLNAQGALDHDGTTVGLYGVAPAGQDVGGQDLTNNVTAGGVDGTVADWAIVDYATDAAAIRNAVYQLARALKQDHDWLRSVGALT